ncbi:hypothetical protein CBS101457_006003 [Exobasidium rhododendri]|nr:hypothetical protein CBS101457_006003 [Exobasidium rhododendri]
MLQRVMGSRLRGITTQLAVRSSRHPDHHHYYYLRSLSTSTPRFSPDKKVEDDVKGKKDETKPPSEFLLTLTSSPRAMQGLKTFLEILDEKGIDYRGAPISFAATTKVMREDEVRKAMSQSEFGSVGTGA